MVSSVAVRRKGDYSSYGDLKEEILEDMISKNFFDFMSEGKGLRHIHKVTLLESRYNNWMKKFACLSQRKKNLLMTKKKIDRNKLPIPIDTEESHIRWIKFASSVLMTFVKNSAVVLGSGYIFFIYDMSVGKWEIISAWKFGAVDGIGCLQGSKDENLFAFSEKCKNARIFIVSYPELQVAYKLRDKLGGKVMELAFGGNETLIVLKCCMSEHFIVVWSWRTSKVIFNYPCENSYVHPEIICISNYSSSCAIMGYNQDKQVLQFWNLNFCGGETLFINRHISELKVNKEIQDMCFSPNNVLYLLDCDGNVYDYDYASGGINFLIPWIPNYKPVPDVMELHHPVSNMLIQSKGLMSPEHIIMSNHLVEEQCYLTSEESLFFKVPKLHYTTCNSDDYEENGNLGFSDLVPAKITTKRCHMVWFDSGIVISGPDGRVKYYCKQIEDESWIKIWGMIPVDPFSKLVSSKTGDLVGWSSKCGLIKITLKEGAHSEVLQYFGGCVHGMCFLHPLDSYLLTINNEPYLYIWKKKTGRLLCYVELPCMMDALLCHFDSPLAVLKSSKEGTIYGVEMKDPRAPVVWPPLSLIAEPFSSISFMHNREILAAVSKNLKLIFVIKVTIEEGFEVISKVIVEHEVINFIHLSTDDRVNRGLALLKATPHDEGSVPSDYIAGKVFHVIKYHCSVIDRIWHSNNFYKRIITGPGIGQVLAIPADKKGEIHNFTISFKKAGGWKFIGSIMVYHQVGIFDMFIHEQHFLTHGYDGMITCYEAEELFDYNVKPFCIIIPHHRFDGGIQEVIVDFKANYIVSRGYNGLTICSRIKLKNRCTHSFHTPRKHEFFYQLSPELKHAKLFSRYEFWDDIYNAKQLNAAAELSKDLRTRIVEEFQEISDIWHACFEENEKEDAINQIPISEFVLNKSKMNYLMSICDFEISEKLQVHEEGLKINKAWNSRWDELCVELMPKKLLKLKPFLLRLVVENYNQTIKPLKYVNHEWLMKMISEMDAVLFPDPVPKMLPWNPLNIEDFYYSQHGQSVEDPHTSKKSDELEANIEDKPPEEGLLKEGKQIQKDSVASERRGLLDEVKAYQNTILQELKSTKRKEKEKIIFLELEKIREFYNDKILKIKYREQGVDKTFEDWKKMYVDSKKSESSDDEEKEDNVLERNIFEDDITVKKKFDNDYEVDEEEEGDKDKTPEGTVDAEEEDAEEENEKEEDENNGLKGNIGENENTFEEKDYIPSGVPSLEGSNMKHENISENPIDKQVEEVATDSDERSSFSWSEIDIGIKKPEELVEVPQKVTSFRKKREREETQVLEFGDLRKKSEVIVVLSTDPLDEPFCMTGAQTSRLIDVDYNRCNEFSLNGLFMADIHVTYLQMIIEQLENDFNKRFTMARERKYKEILRIHKKKMVLLNNIDDLVNVCGGTNPDDINGDYSWTTAEMMPDIIWTDHSIPGKSTFYEGSGMNLKKFELPSITDIRATLSSKTKLKNNSNICGIKDEKHSNKTSFSKKPDIDMLTNKRTDSQNSEVKDIKKENSGEHESAKNVAASASSLKKESINKSIKSLGINTQADGELQHDGPITSEEDINEETIIEESVTDETYNHLPGTKADNFEFTTTEYSEEQETIGYPESITESEIYEDLKVNVPESYSDNKDVIEEIQDTALEKETSFSHDDVGVMVVNENVLEETIVSFTHQNTAEEESDIMLSFLEPSISLEEAEESSSKIDETSDKKKVEERKLSKRESLEQEKKNMKMLQEHLENMMGGAFQLTWQETLKNEIPTPSFLLEKTPEDFTLDDVKALEKYTLLKAIREKEIERRRKIAEEEIHKLTKEIKEIANKFDLDVLDLLKRKLMTEGSLQSELLKIARIKQKRFIAQSTLENINHMKYLLLKFQTEAKKLSCMSKIFFKNIAHLYNEIDKHQAAQKNIEADFFNKLEPLKLTKKYLEILKNCFKKIPILEAENEIFPFELLVIAKSLVKRKSLSYLSEASRRFFKSMEDLDSSTHSPPHLDQGVWNILVEQRRLKIATDIKCNALQMLASEAEKTASLYNKYFVTHLQRYDRIKCHIRDQKIRLENHCRKMEFQLLLPEGLVEAHQTGNIDDFKDCVYVSRKFIDNLNQEIVDLQKEKEKKWKDFDKYMEVVHSAELLHKELRLRIRIKDNLLRDVRTAKMNKYTKEFLLEYGRKKKVYDIKLMDHKKQEKIKIMVQRYFQSYYRSIKNLKKIRDKRNHWINENIKLASENEKFSADNQELLSSLEELNKTKDKRLNEERNQAIILHGKLTRKYEANIKIIDELEVELQRMYMKNYPTFEGN